MSYRRCIAYSVSMLSWPPLPSSALNLDSSSSALNSISIRSLDCSTSSTDQPDAGTAPSKTIRSLNTSIETVPPVTE